MLKRNLRLTKNREIVWLMKNGKRIKGPYFIVVGQKVNLPDFRANVVIGKSAKMKAVERNKVKRQITAAIHRLNQAEPIKGLKFIVRVFRKPDEEVKNDWLDAEVAKCLKQLS